MFNFLKKTLSETETDLVEFMKGNRLFEELSDEEMMLIIPHLFPRSYKKDEVVFFSNDPSQALYIIKNGSVAGSLEVNGDFERLITIEAGEIFGENAVLEDTRRLYTAIVLSDQAEFYVIPRINLQEVMDNHPFVRGKIMTALSAAQNMYLNELFSVYRDSRGFFELSTLFKDQD